MDIAAPGQDILSTFPTFETDIMSQIGFSTDYETISGTSMATPHVAGACALVWAQNPDWNWQMVKKTIIDTADKVQSLEGLCVAEGRLNLYDALNYKPPFLSITKTDDYVYDPNNPTCGVEPNDLITYTIVFHPADQLRTDDVFVIDYLPPETEFVSAVPNTGFLDTFDDMVVYRWNFVDPDTFDTDEEFTLTVRVNEMAVPKGTITNMVEIQLGDYPEYYYWDTHTTDVCCWGGPILYVDQNAEGYETGQSWQNAFTDLQDALGFVNNECPDVDVKEIWVAEGTYVPGSDTGDTFELKDGVALYGGFAGYETIRDQRNWTANPTILTGCGTCDAVVAANEINSAVLDGFIIEASDEYGIKCADSYLHIANCFVHHNGADGIHCVSSDPNISYCTASFNHHGIYCDQSGPLITNCLLEHNGDGIRCNQSDPNIFHSILRYNYADGLYAQSTSAPLLNECLIENNGSDGIECSSDSSLIVTNCKIRSNEEHGIYLNEAEEGTILNNWIHHNQQDGIRIYSCDSAPTIRNNTIVYNADYGIEYSQGSAPTVKNCILWGNGNNPQLSTSISPTYCCIEGLQNPTNGNINNYPEFAYPDPDSYNFHLDPNSACIDAGDNTDIDPNETDIDGDPRIDNDIVDMGADECTCDDVSHQADFNGDGIVNLLDYTPLAAWWLTDDDNGQDPNWPHEYDLIPDTEINLLDLHAFCNNWLWTACYYSPDWYTMERMMSSGSGDIGFGKMSGMQSMSLATMTDTTQTQPPPTVVEITAEQLAELIEDLKKFRETNEEFRRELGEDAWEKGLKYLYEELERLYRQSETKK